MARMDMTVQELIEKLQKQDLEAVVILKDGYGADRVAKKTPGLGRNSEHIPFNSVMIW